jgi:hypothetical protein
MVPSSVTTLAPKASKTAYNSRSIGLGWRKSLRGAVLGGFSFSERMCKDVRVRGVGNEGGLVCCLVAWFGRLRTGEDDDEGC